VEPEDVEITFPSGASDEVRKSRRDAVVRALAPYEGRVSVLLAGGASGWRLIVFAWWLPGPEGLVRAGDVQSQPLRDIILAALRAAGNDVADVRVGEALRSDREPRE
jgi:hypothetical protein